METISEETLSEPEETISEPEIDPKLLKHLDEKRYRERHPIRADVKESFKRIFGQQSDRVPLPVGSGRKQIPAYYGVHGSDRSPVYGPIDWDQIYSWKRVGKEYKKGLPSFYKYPLNEKCMKFLKNHGFEFENRIGEGGYGDVWRAHRVIRVQNNEGEYEDKQYFAVKVLKLKRFNKYQTVKEAVNELMKEGLIHSKLNHRHIVHREEVINHYDEKSGFPQPIFVCIFMELCDGDLYSLREKNSWQTLTESQSHVWFRQIANGLEYIHRQRVVHLDIKPENILYKGDNWDNYVFKLSDFGLSKMYEECEPQTHDRDVGSIYFRAPEVMASAGLRFGYETKPADIFSLGMTLIECFSGKLFLIMDVFRSLHVMPYRHQICGISGNLADLLRGMTEPIPSQRLTADQVITHNWVTNRDGISYMTSL